MAILNDIRNVIKPLTSINYTSFTKDIDHILENMIMNNITMYNSYIFNHIIYNTNIDIKDNIIEIIKKYLGSYIKNQRIHFRNLNKKNILDITNFNKFFDDCYKLINKLTSIFQHILKNNIDKKNETYKWGDSVLWHILIDYINNILLNDVIFKYAIINNIKQHPSHEKNPDMFRLFNYMNIFSNYNINIINNNNNYINIIDETISGIIENNINDILVDNNIEIIYKFKKLYKYCFDYYVNYYYITKETKFIKLNNYMNDFIQNIFERNNIEFIINFINIYKKEFSSLIKHIDINNILLCYPINDIKSFIAYYNNLYNIVVDSDFKLIINECIKENIKKHLKTFEDILHLADLINTNIINKESNEFYYLLGSLCNKDEFMMAICQKYMERIIYSDIDISIENGHYGSIIKYFKNDKALLLKYETLMNDYNDSSKLCNDNIKLIITSLDAWKINHSIGYSDTIINTEEFTTILCNKMFNYNNMNSENIKKKLIMYPHLGCVDIEIYNKKLLVLPAHMLCLELFVSFDTNLTFELIFNKVKQSMSNYTDEFIKSIIDSLIGPILIKTNDSLRIRTDITHTNMIDIFNNNIKQNIIEEMKEDLCHSRIDIIKTNINHFVKQFEYINIDTLYSLVVKNINIFNCNKQLFDESIQYLINNDYVEYKDNNISKKY